MVLLAPRPKPDYAATLTVLAALPDSLADARDRLDMTYKTQARQIGIATSTLSNIHTGSNPTYVVVTACLRWLAANS